MKELDKRIREALREEDAKLLEGYAEEPGVLEMLLETLRGKHRWLNVLGVAWTVTFLTLGIMSGVAFFRSEATRDLVMWASGCVLCVIAVALLKVWYWMEMQRFAVLREIKRVEFQIARLAARLPER